MSVDSTHFVRLGFSRLSILLSFCLQAAAKIVEEKKAAIPNVVNSLVQLVVDCIPARTKSLSVSERLILVHWCLAFVLALQHCGVR